MRGFESLLPNKILSTPSQYFSLEYIRPIEWPEIFNAWRDGEEHQKSWQEHWTERGWDSWEDWRRAYAAPLNPETLQWSLYKIKDPIKELPNFFGVPTKAWIEKAYGGAKTKRFSEIIDFPIIKNNPKVLDIKKSFPEKTILTGMIFKDNIVLIEGMHRAAALASWDSEKNLDSEVMIALAEWPEEKEIATLGGNYNK